MSDVQLSELGICNSHPFAHTENQYRMTTCHFTHNTYSFACENWNALPVDSALLLDESDICTRCGNVDQNCHEYGGICTECFDKDEDWTG